MSRSVFISHSVADKALVEAFVHLLEDGIGLPEDEIFCVSIPGMGIPTGKNFVDYIRDEMEAPKLVIMLITPNYLASSFCQGEMGAAWVKGHGIYPIIVPPSSFADLNGVFLGKQAVRIEDDVRANELKEALVEAIGFKPKSAARWDMARKTFFDALPEILSGLPKPRIVSRDAHEALQEKYEGALAEMAEQEEKIRGLEKLVGALRQAKDAIQVAEIEAELGDDDLGEQLTALLKAAKAELKKLGPTVIRLHVLAKYHQKPFEGWRDEPDAFDAAVRRNLLEENYDLRDRSSAIAGATRALDAIEAFVRANEEELAAFADRNFDAPLETDNEDFWREHLV